jgi:hypothetical protein
MAAGRHRLKKFYTIKDDITSECVLITLFLCDLHKLHAISRAVNRMRPFIEAFMPAFAV